MRIAVVQFDISWQGGAEKSLDNVVSRLALRHTLALFTLQFSPGQYIKLDALKRYEPPIQGSFRGRFTFYYEKKRYYELIKAIKSWQPDVILLNKDFQYSSWLSKETKIPVVLQLRETITLQEYFAREGWNNNKSKNPIRRFYRRFVDIRSSFSRDLGNTRIITCVSKAAAAVAEEKFPSTKAIVIYNGVDHSWFYPTWEDNKYALCISRFDPQKNLHLLMEALGGANYPVVIHGSIGTGEYEADSRAYLERLRNLQPKNFRIEIHSDDVSMRRLLQQCTIFLHPGHDEGFPNAVIEAMSCGKAVVGHDSGGTPECLDGGGFLVGDNPIEWRKKVDELMVSDSLRMELSRNAYEHAERFTWEKTAKKVEDVLEEVLKKGK